MVHSTKGCKQETHILVIVLPASQFSLGAGLLHQSVVFFLPVSTEEKAMADIVPFLHLAHFFILPCCDLRDGSGFPCVGGKAHRLTQELTVYLGAAPLRG